MEEPALFIEKITINEVRHLKDVEISISDTERKHLILTGKNGSGKTSTLLEIKEAIKIALFQHEDYQNLINEKDDLIKSIKKNEDVLYEKNKSRRRSKLDLMYGQSLIDSLRKELEIINGKLLTLKKIDFHFDAFKTMLMARMYEKGDFVIASFNSRRNIQLNIPEGIKKFNLKKQYQINDAIAPNFLQHIVNLKADRSFAKDESENDVVRNIDNWFNIFENSLKDIFEDDKLKLNFKHKVYGFDIILENGQIMPFNALSDGYSAILNIVMELMLRMEGKVKNVYDIQGIVLIDEVETHLHIDLQKKILPFLTSFFPKIQFIVSTHSPFVISSLSNTIVYDLENHTRFEDLSEYPIDGIVEGYFDNDKYSAAVTEKIKEYEILTEKDTLTEIETKRRYELFQQLSDVSGKLAPELKLKFQQIQLKRLAKANG